MLQELENAAVLNQRGYMSIETAITQYSMIAEGLNEFLQTRDSTLASAKSYDPISGALEKLRSSMVNTLDKAIDQNAVAFDITVFRGEHLPPELVSKYRPGTTFSRKGFYSTSKNQRIAQAFANKVQPGEVPVIFKVLLKKGQSALDFAEFDYLDSINKHEQEVLLPRNLDIKVIDRHNEGSFEVITVEINTTDS